MIQQTEVTITTKPRSLNKITLEIEKALRSLEVAETALLQLFLQHTSASLCLNENADPDVLIDLEMASHHLAPETLNYRHTMEGPDDMPAHIKSSLFGQTLSIPIKNGKLGLGTWQGIYLFQHRANKHHRNIILTKLS